MRKCDPRELHVRLCGRDWTHLKLSETRAAWAGCLSGYRSVLCPVNPSHTPRLLCFLIAGAQRWHARWNRSKWWFLFHCNRFFVDETRCWMISLSILSLCMTSGDRSVIVSTFPVRKLRLREVKPVAQRRAGPPRCAVCVFIPSTAVCWRPCMQSLANLKWSLSSQYLCKRCLPWPFSSGFGIFRVISLLIF